MNFETELISSYEELRQFAEEINPNSWCDSGLHYMLWPYYAAIELRQFRSFCVAVKINNKPAALAIANDVNGRLCYFQEPVRFAFDRTINHETREKAFSIITIYLLDLMNEHALGQLILNGEHNAVGAMPDWQIRLLDNGAESKLNYSALIDLSNTEEVLRRRIRKSYKSLINWGRKNIALTDINVENPDRQLFDQFQSFHREVAGRVTRPQASWDEMFSLIQSGRAELSMGWYDHSLVAATYVDYDPHYALYGTGVYDRERFDKPISHWPVYHAVLNAKNRGQLWFELGNVYLHSASSKEQNIAFFKKGFTNQIQARTIWTLSQKGMS